MLTLSCRTPLNPFRNHSDLPIDSFANPSRRAEPQKNTPYVLWRNPLFARNFTKVRTKGVQTPQGGDIRAKIDLQIETSTVRSIYSISNNVVKKIIPSGSVATGLPDLASAVLRARKSLGYTQEQMAIALNVSQGNVAKWEKGKLTPPGQIMAALAKIAPDDDKQWWLKQAGFGDAGGGDDNPPEVREVPLLLDSAAAGTPRAVNENEIERVLRIPIDWVPRGGKLYAVKITGDSMSPILETGYIAIIDVSRRDPVQLVNRMIAARDADGVTIKWLREDNQLYFLVPQNTSPRHPVKAFTNSSSLSIVGEVLTWTGWPPPPPKRK